MNKHWGEDCVLSFHIRLDIACVGYEGSGATAWNLMLRYRCNFMNNL